MESGIASAEGAHRRVTVVLPTRYRPDLLRRAVRSFFAQTGDHISEIIVVFDQSPVDKLDDLRQECPSEIQLRVVPNSRTPGLAGARNTGICLGQEGLVAFCDDDDEWLPQKLQAQLDLWDARPEASAVGTGMRIETQESSRVKTAPAEVSYEDFLRTRQFSIPSSGLLLRKADLMGEVGLVDEDLPAAYGEDWDLLLRLSRRGPVVNVQEPVVVVHWDRPSFYAEKWQGIVDGLTYILNKHPDLQRDRTGFGRLAGQIGFAKAALGDRRGATTWVWRALRSDPRQLRAWAALPVAMGAVDAGTLVTLVNRRGRGL